MPLGYLVVIFAFTGTTYGLLEKSSTLYSRGMGQFGFPLIFFYLIGMYLLALVMPNRYKNYTVSREPVSLLFLLLAGYVLLYLLVGLGEGMPPANVLSHFGMVNIVGSYMLYIVIKRTMNGPKILLLFVRVVIWVAGLMAVYGLIRFVFAGGDPANFYANVQGRGVRITYFDFAQAGFFTVAAALLYLKHLAGERMSLLDWTLLGLFLMNVVLSFRRTAWVGLALVLLWLTMSSRGGRRIYLLVIGLLVAASIGTVYQERFGMDKKGAVESFTSDLRSNQGEISIKSGRFSELYYAVKAAGDNYAFGLGPWGVNKPRIKRWHEADYVHSAIVHVYIKTGIIGTILYVALLGSYFVWWYKRRKGYWHLKRHRVIGDAFYAGFLFSLPDIVFGTPLINYRHMQFFALYLAIPILCVTADAMMARHKSAGCRMSWGENTDVIR